MCGSHRGSMEFLRVCCDHHPCMWYIYTSTFKVWKYVEKRCRKEECKEQKKKEVFVLLEDGPSMCGRCELCDGGIVKFVDEEFVCVSVICCDLL